MTGQLMSWAASMHALVVLIKRYIALCCAVSFALSRKKVEQGARKARLVSKYGLAACNV